MPNHQNSTWICTCGFENEPEFDKCLICSLERSKNRASSQTQTNISEEKNRNDRMTNEARQINNSSNQNNDKSVSWRSQSSLGGNERFPSTEQKESGNGQEAEQQPIAKELSSAEINEVINCILHGSDSDVVNAIAVLVNFHPTEAVLPLVQIAQGNRTKEKNRQSYAITALGYFGDPSVIPALIEINKSPELIPTICSTLGKLQHPSAIPYLANIVTKGLSISFNLSLREEEEKTIKIMAQANALSALANIGHPDAIAPIIIGTTNELNNTTYMDDTSGRSTNLLLFAAETAFKSIGASKNAAIAISYMVSDLIEIDSALQFPGEIRKMCMLQHRRRELGKLCERCGAEPFISCFLNTKDSIQKLMVALPLIDQGITEKDWYDCLAESTKSNRKEERILAYDGFVQAAARYKIPNLVEWSRAGLGDRDTTVQLAVAASIMFNRLEPLLLAAINYKNSTKATSRAAMIPPLIHLAAHGDARGEMAVKELSNNDTDKIVRAIATDFLQELPEMKEAIKSDEEALLGALDQIEQIMNDQEEMLHNAVEEAKAKSNNGNILSYVQQPITNDQTASNVSPWEGILPANNLKEPLLTTDSLEPLPCPICGRIIPAGLKSCPRCMPPRGASAIKTQEVIKPEIENRFQNKCPQCGDQIQEDSVFCPNCGEHLSINSVPNQIIQDKEIQSIPFSESEFDSLDKGYTDGDGLKITSQADFGNDFISNKSDKKPSNSIIAYCMHCGYKIIGDEQFCTNCGNRLEL